MRTSKWNWLRQTVNQSWISICNCPSRAKFVLSDTWDYVTFHSVQAPCPPIPNAQAVPVFHRTSCCWLVGGGRSPVTALCPVLLFAPSLLGTKGSKELAGANSRFLIGKGWEEAILQGPCIIHRKEKGGESRARSTLLGSFWSFLLFSLFVNCQVLPFLPLTLAKIYS